MEKWIEELVMGLGSPFLLVIIAVTLYTLGKGADWLVDEAVTLSVRWGLGKAVIGATIVSIGTTTPEAAVSVFSAIQGKPGLALGNAVGSIICDTGLIIGLASLIAPLPLNRQLASRLSNVQVGAGILPGARLFSGGLLQRNCLVRVGFCRSLSGSLFVVLLALYIWQSIRWAATMSDAERGRCTRCGGE